MPSFQKRVFNLKSFWKAANDAFESIFKLRQQKSGNTVDRKFTERIMLAVTQVNGCRYCSFGHTQAALKTGLDSEEIRELLSGDLSNAPQEEITALLFAQHYAESAGQPDPETWEKLVLTYGQNNALKILANIRMITIGNLLGNTFDAFFFRITGRASHPESSIFQELGVLAGSVFILPAAMLKQRFSKPQNMSPIPEIR